MNNTFFRKFIKRTVIIASILIGAVSISVAVIAEGPVDVPGGGGEQPKGDCSGDNYSVGADGWVSGGSAKTNCCDTRHERCPRIMCGSGSDYAAAWASRDPSGSYNVEEGEKCLNASRVCWVGVRNADGSYSVWNRTNYQHNRFNWGGAWDISTGQWGLGADEIDRALDSYGKNGSNAAAWCDLTDPDPEPIKVDLENTCNTWGVSVPEETHVASGIRNSGLAKNQKGYGWIISHDEEWGESTNKVVWAKQGDSIFFHDCYYSGLQSFRNRKVTSENIPPKKPAPIGSEWVGIDPPPVKRKGPVDKKVPLADGTNNVEFKDAIPWKTNGATITGVRNGNVGGNQENNEGPKMYNFPEEDSPSIHAEYKIPALEHLGGDKVHTKNYHQIKSDFYGAVRQARVTPTEDWSCNEYLAEKEITGDYPAIGQGTYPPNDCDSISYEYEYDQSHQVTKTIWTCYKTESAKSTCSSPYIDWWIGNPSAVAATAFAVPYNFINEGVAHITGPIYDGEEMGISVDIVTKGRYNRLTNGFYATMVPNADWQIYMYVSKDGSGSDNNPSGGCSTDCWNITQYADKQGGQLNPSDNMGGDTLNVLNGVFRVPDRNAGNFMCVMVIVGEGGNSMDDNNLDGHSSPNAGAPYCRVINKKTTFQIRGGGLYVDSTGDKGAIVGSGAVAHKNNVNGMNENEYSPQKYSDEEIKKLPTRKYYSWVEHEIVVGHNAKITRLASGASINVPKPDASKKHYIGGTEWGGSFDEEAFKTRKYQPLTIPTVGVSITNIFKGIGSSLNLSFKEKVINSIVNRYGGEQTCNINDKVLMENGSIHVFYCDGKMRINASIEAKNTKMEKASDVPIAIIYAKDDIIIGKDVYEIDGWVITEKNLNTCDGIKISKPEKDPDNNKRDLIKWECSVYHLTINGPVVANTIELMRGYGANQGRGSTNPAELFNLSTGVYLFGASRSALDETKINSVYMRELAPRY